MLTGEIYYFYFYIVLIIIDRLLYICLSVKYDEKYHRNNLYYKYIVVFCCKKLQDYAIITL